MLIAPTFENFDVNKRPLATLFLIVVCSWVFLVVQNGDHQRYNSIIYLSGENGLTEMETKFFRSFQKSKPPNKRRVLPDKNKYKYKQLYYRDAWQKMHRDVGFQKGLKAGSIITKEYPRYWEWQNLRAEQEEALKKVIFYTYSFKPAWPSWITALTSTFLHANFQHLLGNMVFLFLGGVLLEAIVGSIPFLVIYVITGVVASYTSVQVYGVTDPTALCYGASGAVSGILGAYGVLLGLKKVPVYISFSVFFGTIRLPAILLLLVWCGKEVWSFVSHTGSNVNYMAHLGGYLAGGALGIPCRFFCKDRIETLVATKKSEEKQKLEGLVEKGRKHLQNLQYSQAQKCMQNALALSPGDPTILNYLCAIYKQLGDGREYRKNVEKLCLILLSQENKRDRVAALFNEYTEQDGWILSEEVLQRLAGYFAQYGYAQEVSTITKHLCCYYPTAQDTPHTILLAGRLLLKNKHEEGVECLKMLGEFFPERQETKMATELLNVSK